MDARDTVLFQEQIAKIIGGNPSKARFHRNDLVLPEQTFRVSTAPRNASERTTVAGTQATADIVIVGAPTLDVLRGDRFALNGNTYEVIFVNNSSKVLRKAECIQNG
jgi:hypothetical protein